MSEQKTLTPEEKLRATLSNVLQQLNLRLLRSEIQDVTDRANINSRNTTVSYLLGSCPKRETAESIIKAAREIIAERENSISKIIAA